MTETAKDILLGMGFSKTETAVLIDLMKNDESNCRDIADRLDTYRANIYEGIRMLESKGIVTSRKLNYKTKRGDYRDALFFRIKKDGLKDYVNKMLLNIDKLMLMINNDKQ